VLLYYYISLILQFDRQLGTSETKTEGLRR